MNLHYIICFISMACSIGGCYLVVIKGQIWAYLIVLLGLALSFTALFV